MTNHSDQRRQSIDDQLAGMLHGRFGGRTAADAEALRHDADHVDPPVVDRLLSRLHQRRPAGLQGLVTAEHQGRRIDQQAGGDAFVEAVPLEVAGPVRDLHQLGRRVRVATRLLRDDLHFHFLCRVVEVQRGETLLGRLLEILHQALVTRVVGDRHTEIRAGLQQLTEFLHGQYAAVVRQRVDHHRGVLTRLDDFVQVADSARAHRARERAVHPDRLATVNQEATHQVRGGQIVVAGDRDQRTLQAPRHMLHEAGLATAGRPLQ